MSSTSITQSNSELKMDQMFVIKRNGERQVMLFDNITRRNQKLANDLKIDTTSLSMSVIQGLKSGMTTREIDLLSCENAIYKSTYEPNYATLASRIAVNDLHKTTPKSFRECLEILNKNVNSVDNKANPLIDDKIYEFALENMDIIESCINYKNDYNYSYFGFKTLEKSYLQKVDGKVVERPQSMLMRVALGIHGPSNRNGIRHEGDIKLVLQTYKELSLMKFTHATPTLFYAGTPKPQMSSCFLLNCPDSINGITDCWKTASFISKHAGGIGIDLTVRSKGSYIAGTNGYSNGIIPLIKVFNEIARYVDQCFTPETSVYTLDGIKRIEDVGVMDKVLSSDGIYHKVKSPVRHEYNGKMLELKLNGSLTNVRVTPEHQVLSLLGQNKETDQELIKYRLDNGSVSLCFNDIKELKEGDFMVYPIPTFEQDNDSLTEEDCYFYGMMLERGTIIPRNKSSIFFEQENEHCIKFVENYLSTRAIKYEKITQGYISIEWSTNSLGFKFVHSQLYSSNNLNIKIESSMLHLPKNKIKQMLKGLFSTTNSICEKEITLNLNRTKFLINDIKYLLLRLGIHSYSNPLKFQNTPEFNELLQTQSIPLQYSNNSVIHYKSNLLVKIDSIKETEYSGTVHDFEIEEPHDYVLTHLGVAHNGGGKRKGAISLYLQPWHPDVFEFLEIRMNTGPEEARARDIFPAMWIPDLFFKRLQETNGKWSLFCPGKYPELVTLYGEEFEKRYIELENQKCFEKQIQIEELWKKILKSLEETGLPYMMSKDNVNNKSNHKNIGPITGSNLCTEIVQYHDSNSTAVCNLASICLSQFIKNDNTFDFEELGNTVRIIVHNMNNIIDKNYYPEYEVDVTIETNEGESEIKAKKTIGRNNNLKYRPIGIGVQGLSDAFAKMKFPWESSEARRLNQVIFETIYFNALTKSNELALKDGSYSAFQGSPVSQGILQCDMWNTVPLTHSSNWKEDSLKIPLFDWDILKENVKKGIRNSLMIAPMPTAGTSQIMGNTEAFEPLTSNLYVRKVGAGDFPIVNHHLYKDLKELNMWNKELIDKIVMNNGSIQGIENIPDNIKKLYKTVWEIPQKIIVDFAADRGAFIDQTQSLNIFMERPTVSKLSSLYMYGWKRGLKTLSYYLRTKPATGAVKFSIMNTENKQEKNIEVEDKSVYKINKFTGQKFICNEDVCTSCSS